ncbi:MAG: sulfite exporter TauE/SafE family protein [Chitinophagaceae bacterium]|nr:MAG: sulfite exporter TauE/SafE family protein [Chitinophagaceae bacterium]
MALWLIAMLMGAVGSMHCVGMCGPLAIALPVVSPTPAGKFFYTLLYNLGRIVTYTCLGAILGVVGASFAVTGLQQWLSIGVGILILLYIIFPRHRIAMGSAGAMQRLFNSIRTRLSELFFKKKYHSVFVIGLLNGLLPCGLVYMAIAGAVATASVTSSMLFMAGFGLGTLPVMWSVSFFGSFITLRTRTIIKKAYPYLMVLMACLLIVRGLGLNIPYISPQLPAASGMEANVQCH